MRRAYLIDLTTNAQTKRDCPSASELALMNMDENDNCHTTTKHKKYNPIILICCIRRFQI